MAAATKLASIAESLGVAPDQLEADIKVRPPEDQEKAARDHERVMAEMRLKWRFSFVALLFCAALCWLFLHYGRPEQAEKMIALVVGLIGGIGIGRGTSEK